MNPRYTDMCKHIEVTSGPWQPKYKWMPVKLTAFRKCFLLFRQEAAGSEVHRFKAANKVRKNWPKSIKKCPSSLFCFITQAVADPNHPTQFHPHLGLLPALLNMQGHCPSGRGQALEHHRSICSASLPGSSERDYRTQLWVGQVSQIWSSATRGSCIPLCPQHPQPWTRGMTTLFPGRIPDLGLPTFPCLRGCHSVSDDDL